MKSALIDTDFDFTQDTEGYWKYWWTAEKGDELTGSRYVSDPDSQSKTLNDYHKSLWSKQLPDGRLWDLKSRKGRGYYFEWNDGIKPRYYSSDSLLNSFRWTGMKPVLKQVKNHVEGELKLDYHKWLENYVRKLYTIGGMIIFPARQGSINVIRAFTKVKDRVDLTFECIRRWYIGEKTPMYNCLEKDKDFFALFGNFKGYVDFFLLQDIVSDDYMHVNCLLGNREYCDDFFKTPQECTVPQTVEEYMQWHDKTLDFADKRNRRIKEWAENRQSFSSGRN